ncbi:hypothetical protein MTR67_036392 [Solanum verrucosum]|uniref:Uncharacterized protein n=1 Tax=Solanum verrucosum TaxID=315347 RepID=A0AAF0ZL42_SOLVR|nr:hypothetical protein MTR67_036392 [Solanum verrucosum]
MFIHKRKIKLTKPGEL